MNNQDETVYVIAYFTHDLKHGAVGAWRTKPTKEQVDAYMEQEFPDEWEVWCVDHGYECEGCAERQVICTVYYSVIELTLTNVAPDSLKTAPVALETIDSTKAGITLCPHLNEWIGCRLCMKEEFHGVNRC